MGRDDLRPFAHQPSGSRQRGEVGLIVFEAMRVAHVPTPSLMGGPSIGARGVVVGVGSHWFGVKKHRIMWWSCRSQEVVIVCAVRQGLWDGWWGSLPWLGVAAAVVLHLLQPALSLCLC